MKRVQEEKISNEDIRRTFLNIPTINTFFTRRTWRYIGKIVRDKQNSFQKKLLGAWIHQPHKPGCPQNSTKMHFLITLKTVLPGISDKGLFKEWHGLAKDENQWDSIITDFIETQWNQMEEEEEAEENTEDTDMTPNDEP